MSITLIANDIDEYSQQDMYHAYNAGITVTLKTITKLSKEHGKNIDIIHLRTEIKRLKLKN